MIKQKISITTVLTDIIKYGAMLGAVIPALHMSPMIAVYVALATKIAQDILDAFGWGGTGIVGATINVVTPVGPAAKSLLLFIGLGFMLSMTACGTLDKTGPYRGDQTLYAADSTMITAYQVIDAFEKWELMNRGKVSSIVTSNADNIRVKFPGLVAAYQAARTTYLNNPTPGNFTSVRSILNTIQGLVDVANSYLNPPTSAIK